MCLCVGVQEDISYRAYRGLHLQSCFLRSWCLGLINFHFLQKEEVQTGNLWTWTQIKQLSNSQDAAFEEISEDMWLMRGSSRSERQSKGLTWFEDVYSRMIMIL